MSYRIAGIDVHKKMLAVVVSDVEIEEEYQFERRLFGSSPEQLRSLAAWLLGQEVEEVVMESTAQYWKPVWEVLERYWKPLRQKREGARFWLETYRHLCSACFCSDQHRLARSLEIPGPGISVLLARHRTCLAGSHPCCSIHRMRKLCA
jgi:hypothetical protein